MSNSRLEKFIYAICGMEVDDLPTPLSRIEMLWNCLITGETPDFEPLSRNEKYLMSMLTGDVDALPEPASRSEKLLYKIATGETDLTDVPGYLSRYEELLKYLIENGGIGGTDFEYVLYTLNDSFSTLYTTAEGPVKSAILSGSTERRVSKNLFNGRIRNNADINSATGQESQTGSRTISLDYTPVLPSTEYTFTRPINTKQMGYRLYRSDKSFIKFQALGNNLSATFTTTSDTAYFKFIDEANTLTEGYQLELGSVATEYEPYFEPHLISCKMPVLTTYTNLFPGFITKGYIGSDGKHYGIDGDLNYLSDFIEITNNKLSFRAFSSRGVALNVFGEFAFYDENKTFIGYKYGPADEVVEAPINTKYIRVWAVDRNNPTDNVKGMLIYSDEKPSNIATYEPYKSNILSCNEEVTLRGIGEVKDTLDGNTGELTQRIGEIVLDGSQPISWKINHNTSENTCIIKADYRLIFDNEKPTIGYFRGWNVICNRFKIVEQGVDNEKLGNLWGDTYFGNNLFGFVIEDNILENNDSDSVNKYLAENPIIIDFKLDEPTIKTVVLSTLDQDGQPTNLNTFDDITHVSIEAEDLLPTIDLEVATKIEETLSSLPTQMIDISETQQLLNEKIDEQAENIKEVSTAMIEIRNDIL